ncbi:MAG: hypothetical protein K2N65_05030, partial [Anaeroplasmataceae bacterium]|nr:hypothetical protein [Anaeroplasmataceae bacterium]
QEVYYESDFGKYLRSNQFKFDEKYQVIDHTPTPFSIEKHNVRVEEMTESDSYLKAYYPTPMQYRHINYHDNIINIVPEWWFYVEGPNMYFGKEYGVYVHTTKTLHGVMGCPCFKSSVTIWDFETTIPGLSEKYSGSESFVSFVGYELSIKNAIEYSYSAFRRSDMNYETWKLHFDTNEDKIILQEEDTFHRVFLAPENSSFAIDNDVSYNYSIEKFTLNDIEYRFTTSNNLQQKVSELEMAAFFASSFTQLSGFIPEDLNPDIPVTSLASALLNCVIHFATIHAEADAKDSAKKLEYTASSASYECSYVGQNQAGKPIIASAIAINHCSYSSIFSNPLLKDYEHHYKIKLNCSYKDENADFFKDLYVAFNDCFSFNIYNSSGNVISNATREVEYGNLCSVVITPDLEKEFISSIPLSVNISRAGTPNIFVIKPLSTGIYKLNCDNKDMRIEVYDKNGDLIANNHQYDFENSFCAYLDSGARYIV